MASQIPPNATLSWQEYQELVAVLYERMGQAGTLHYNITRPDRITGQARQIDTWIEVEARGHTLGILIDAKKYSAPVDVRDIESVAELAMAVGACKAVIVCAAGWTAPAEKKAEFLSMDLHLFTIEQALDIKYEEAWVVCPGCNDDVIWFNAGYFLSDGWSGLFELFVAGLCNSCGMGRAWCWDCGSSADIEPTQVFVCGCGHRWSVSDDQLYRLAWDRSSDFDGEVGVFERDEL